jgi:hypothetical protein
MKHYAYAPARLQSIKFFYSKISILVVAAREVSSKLRSDLMEFIVVSPPILKSSPWKYDCSNLCKIDSVL